MNFFVFILVYSGFIFGCGYVFMQGDPDEPGMVNALNRLITRDLVEAIRWSLSKCFGRRGVDAYDSCEDWLCYSANPLLQFFYLGMILSGFCGFVLLAMPFIPCNPLVPCWPEERTADDGSNGTSPFLSSWHRVTAWVAMTATLLSWVLCSYSNPGVVNEKSSTKAYCFEWDNMVRRPTPRLLLLAGGRNLLGRNRECHAGRALPNLQINAKRICPASGLIRPARASYCRYTDAMVLKFDHFCPWIKNVSAPFPCYSVCSTICLHVLAWRSYIRWRKSTRFPLAVHFFRLLCLSLNALRCRCCGHSLYPFCALRCKMVLICVALGRRWAKTTTATSSRSCSCTGQPFRTLRGCAFRPFIAS